MSTDVIGTPALAHPAGAGTWRLIARRLGPERLRLAWLGVALVISTALPLAGPQLTARVVNLALARGPLRTMALLAVAYLATQVVAQAATVACSYLASGAAWRTTNRLREEVAGHALRLDMSFHGRHTPGEMIERVDGDLLGLATMMSSFVINAISSALLLAGTIVLVWLVDARIGVALTLLVAVGAGSLLLSQRRAAGFADASREQEAQLFGSIEEWLQASEDIRANGAGRHVLRRLHERVADVFQADRRWEFWGGLVISQTELTFAVGTVVVLALGVLLLGQGAITVGTLVLLFQYAQMVQGPIEQMVNQAKELQKASEAAGRVGRLLRERPSIRDPSEALALPSSGPLSLRFLDVTFAYGTDPPVIRQVSLELGAGRTLGLVGRTGSGKTTLARLALRLYDPQLGAVQLGGVDVRSVGLADLQHRTRLVTQEVHLFAASVRENVTLFDATVEDSRVIGALEEVGLGDWLRRMPRGLDTPLKAGGVGLSAGEEQLIALARVFAADPGLIVLDEPSSRLDPISEARLQAATARLLRGRTAIVIAHRLSTLATVDEVAVLEGGNLVEHGPRGDLIGDAESRFAGMLAAGVA
ncbi:MAG TPA: ABC transporter ATP-binding protein [Candidatus Dormibacteraeota bacterium]|jgi:ABC-type multidrug transport system fused ATPase/permease subunit|nr:ABC transporter ATP-binding protein [Candidatus Dormibacteraeota bacterium]